MWMERISRMFGDELQLGPVRKAQFIERPNRFLVRCREPHLGVIEAYLPNPGRLWELFFPGVILHLTSVPPSSPRRTRYSVLAVECRGEPILLDTHLCNKVARFLIERGRIPELAGAEVIRAEVPVGRSRFDFLLQRRRRKIYLEVKSCTLFGNGVAMFPDAVTERGRRHLIELAKLTPQVEAAVLFLVQSSRVQQFMPDYHTDLAFSQSLLEVKDKVRVLAASLEWRPDLSLASGVRMLKVPWRHLKREVKDRGSDLYIWRLRETKRLQVGRLGELTFSGGYYIYVGSAMSNLTARLARHSRHRKKLHWHVDYLRREAGEFLGLPIRSSLRQECEVARGLAELFSAGPAGFGSSDCSCPTHLFYSGTNPIKQVSFHEFLQHFRMRQA